MKNIKYHAVGTITKYHAVGTILKYHVVGTIPKSMIKIVVRGKIDKGKQFLLNPSCYSCLKPSGK